MAFGVRRFGSLVSTRAVAASRGSNNQRRDKHHEGKSGDRGCAGGGGEGIVETTR